MGRKGKLFVVSGPSGSGKTTLCCRLLTDLSGRGRLARSISVTTRQRRRGERQRRDYFFISAAEFAARRKARKFLEWARVLNYYYGTPRDFVRRNIDRGQDVLLSIDVQGAQKIRRRWAKAVFIFILPPSLRALKQRLERRSTDSREEIMRRLQLAREEMTFAKEYDYVILNDNLSRALARLKKIIQLERER